MSRRCELTGKGPIVKNKVSHSNVKTKTWMLPNIKKRRLFSDALGSYVTLRVATGTIRSIEHDDAGSAALSTDSVSRCLRAPLGYCHTYGKRRMPIAGIVTR